MRKETRFIVIHCSASQAKATWVDAKVIDQWHRKRGWMKIGYHYVITRLGVLQTGRKLDEIGAHVQGYNHLSVGICLVGGVADDGKSPEDNFTPDQKEILHNLLTDLRKLYPAAKIVGHWKLDSKKTCPNFDIKKFLLDRPGLNPVESSI